MQSIETLPDCKIVAAGEISTTFLTRGITTFLDACRHVHRMPYGYNTDRENLFILFKEGKGTCATKHAVIATLAQELGLDVGKQIGIYAMTEALVTGAQAILDRYGLPYLPMVHCFLASGSNRVDLTEGNHNGKNGPVDDFLHFEPAVPNIAEKDEYMIYRRALTEIIRPKPEFQDRDTVTILKARQEGLVLLKANVLTA